MAVAKPKQPPPIAPHVALRVIVPARLHRALKVEAAERGITLTVLVTAILRDAVKRAEEVA